MSIFLKKSFIIKKNGEKLIRKALQKNLLVVKWTNFTIKDVMKKIYFYTLALLLFLAFLIKILVFACNFDLTLNIFRIKSELSAIVKRVKEFKDLFKILGGMCKQLWAKISWIFYNAKNLSCFRYVVAVLLFVKRYAFYFKQTKFNLKNFSEFNCYKNIPYEKGRLI